MNNVDENTEVAEATEATEVAEATPTLVEQNNQNGNPVTSIQPVEVLPYFPVRSYSLNGSVVSWDPSVMGSYGWRRKKNGVWARAHSGSDIYTADGEPVRAIKDGTIVAEESFSTPSPGWGNTCVITVDHGDILVRYCEVGNVVATSGPVTRGQKIATVKKTSWTSQAMLHLEIYNKTETGSLTDESSTHTVPTRPTGHVYSTSRRKDALDPASYLDEWKNNLPPPL